VLLVQRWILARLRNRQFFSLVELNRAIAELLIDLNLRPFKKLPGCRRSAFELLDAPALRPLPTTRFANSRWKVVKVNIDYHVEFEGHYYSVPHRLVGLRSFERWCASHEGLTGNVRRNRQRIARNWCLYRQRSEPSCFVPDPNRFPRPHPHKAPVIIAPAAVGRMLAVAQAGRPTPDSALRPDALRLATVLLYTAGLRRGELLHLQLGDVNALDAVLRVRESKFHKSRWVPLSKDAGAELRVYLRRRQHQWGVSAPTQPLLCHGTRHCHGYTGTGLSTGLQELVESANVRGWDGPRPRAHDFRHNSGSRIIPSTAPMVFGTWWRSSMCASSGA
jgi:integrase